MKLNRKAVSTRHFFRVSRVPLYIIFALIEKGVRTLQRSSAGYSISSAGYSSSLRDHRSIPPSLRVSAALFFFFFFFVSSPLHLVPTFSSALASPLSDSRAT